MNVMDEKAQHINVTLYPLHIAIIDAVSRELADTRCNRSRALRHIIADYAARRAHLAQPPAASDRGGEA